MVTRHPRTELSLCYVKHTNFYLENKGYCIQIRSIASFKPFLTAWLWGHCTFSYSSVVSLKYSPWLVSSQTAVKGRHGFEIRKICAARTGTRYKTEPNVFEMCSRVQTCFPLFFMCLISPTQKFILGKNTTNTKE